MSKRNYSVTFKGIRDFNKSITVDSDKSLSIRSILIGSICEGISVAENLLESDDVNSTINFVKKLGVGIKKIKRGKYLIYGQGLGGLHAKKNTTLDLGNSGTLCRLGSGLLSTCPNLNLKLSGDESLKKRNLKTLIDILKKFGAFVSARNKNYLPIKLISSNMPSGINYTENRGSAQIVSAIALASLNSFGKTKIIQTKDSRNHTQIFLKRIGAKIKIKKEKKNNIIEVNGKTRLNSFKTIIPGDPSSAAFFIALTILNKKSKLKLKNIGLNPTRIGFYNLLKKHGAKIKIKNIKKKNNEIIGDIIVKSGKIKPINCNPSYYSKTVDEYPILFVISALNKGVGKFTGIKDLANKESNRILEMQKLLKKINIKCQTFKDGFRINGVKKVNIPKKIIVIDPKLDHRICQSAAVLALATGVKIKIKNFQTVNTSAPSFLKKIKYLGGKFEIKG